MQSVGIVARDVSKDDLYKLLPEKVNRIDPENFVWDRVTFDALIAAGFELDAWAFKIVETELWSMAEREADPKKMKPLSAQD